MPVIVDRGKHSHPSIPSGLERLIAYQLREAQLPVHFDWLVKGITAVKRGGGCPPFKVVGVTPHGAVEVIVRTSGDEARSCKIIPPNRMPAQQVFEALRDSLSTKPVPPVTLNGAHHQKMPREAPVAARTDTTKEQHVNRTVTPVPPSLTAATLSQETQVQAATPATQPATAQENKKESSFKGFLRDQKNIELMLLAIASVLGKRTRIKYVKACRAVEKDVAQGASPKAIGALMRELAKQGHVEMSGEKEKKEICLSAKGYNLIGVKHDVPTAPVAPPQKAAHDPEPKVKASGSIGKTIALIRAYISWCDEKLATIDREVRELSKKAAKTRAAREELEHTIETLQRLEL